MHAGRRIQVLNLSPSCLQLSFNEPNDAAKWTNQPYHEEVHFPTQPMPGCTGGRGGTLNRSNAGRFSAGKLNKSSSMHDIAHGLAATAAATNVAPAPPAGGAAAAAEFNPMRNVLVSNDGVSWEDQQLPGVPHWQTTQSAINHPAMNGLLNRPSVNSAQFRKTNGGGSAKGAHRQHMQQQQQAPSEFWNPMWSAASGAPPPLHGSHAAFDPTMNPFHNPMMTPMHRSMHDLHSAVSGGFMMGQPQGPQSYQHAAAAAAAQFMAQQQQRASSPSNASQKSKRSAGGKFGRKTRRSGGGGSRPHSRNVSSRNSRVRPGSSIAATSTEEEEGEGEGEAEDDDEDDSDSEDFFTGESDAGGSGGGTATDYVAPPPPTTKAKSASSVPRKAWMCEHCTFVNSAGTSVCTVCCRTSKHSRSGAAGPAPNETANHNQGQGGTSIKNKSKKAKDGARSASTTRRPRYNSSDDDDEDFAEDLSDFDRQRSSKASRLPGLQQQHRGRYQKLSSRGRAGMAKSMTDLDSLGPHGGAGALEDEFDLEQDAINTYYAVRMGERRRSTALMRRGDDEGELRLAI